MDVDGAGIGEGEKGALNDFDDGGDFCRKRKRTKTVPMSLVDDYHCDKEILKQARKTQFLVYRDGQEAD